MSRKVLLGVVAILLMCAPMGLTAQEREARNVPEASVLESLDSLWRELALWFDSVVDGGCAIDPDGCPGGA